MLYALLLVQAASQCPAMDADLPAPLTAWTNSGHGDPTDLTRPVVLKSLTPAALASSGPRPTASPKEWTPQQPEPAQTDGAARIGFRIRTAGIYGIALDQPGWIDVTPTGGAGLVSASHGHGPVCSTIRKIVRFELATGDYVLNLSRLTRPMAKVMLVAGETP